jgi:pyruvate,water dikinase
MPFWRRQTHAPEPPGVVAGRVRAKYKNFRDLLSINNECLELMAGLQEDLQFAPPRREVLEERIGSLFTRVQSVVAALDSLTGVEHPSLAAVLAEQRNEIERYVAAIDELGRPRLSMWLSEVGAAAESDAGSKAAMLGEVRNKLGLPVPDGFVLTTEAYRQCCGIPLWREVRDATRDLDLNDLDAVKQVSAKLTALVMEAPVPRAIEVAIEGRAETLLKSGGALAVRSSAEGEGGARTYAGQFLSVLNVPADQALDAYKRVLASRFSERALFYRLSTGLVETASPMAVLFLTALPARAAGILYTRDPGGVSRDALWIAATRGLGPEIASGRTPADLFVVSRSRPHRLIESSIAHKEEELAFDEGGGLRRRPLRPGAFDEPSLQERHLHTLAEWGAAIERHFKTPQDIEWVLDESDRLWIVQSRPLAHIEAQRSKARSRIKAEPRLTGGRTVYPGRTSGRAFLVDEIQNIGRTPAGAVVFIRKPSPEIVQIFPRIAGLVAEWGNVAGHAAALLREFQIPSVFLMTGAFERISGGEPVSLDAVQTCIYGGALWPPARTAASMVERKAAKGADPIGQRLLTLNLLDPAAYSFRPAGCKSAHDVLRYCHEKAIETMFAVNDFELERGAHCAKQLDTPLPFNILALDLGGGIEAADPGRARVAPSEIVSRPFQALWKGISRPDVTWTREMPARISDLASVLANSFTPQGGAMRPLGEKSYLLVADEYLNLNSRLAYHYSLVDACLSDTPGNNYISFRFEGGGATRQRRSLRACFLERCLARHGFQVDRRTDLVNAWFRKAPADQTAGRLDILGRLMACSSQLDMYMTSREVMLWYVEQFMAGNYTFRTPADRETPAT